MQIQTVNLFTLTIREYRIFIEKLPNVRIFQPTLYFPLHLARFLGGKGGKVYITVNFLSLGDNKKGEGMNNFKMVPRTMHDQSKIAAI